MKPKVYREWLDATLLFAQEALASLCFVCITCFLWCVLTTRDTINFVCGKDGPDDKL